MNQLAKHIIVSGKVQGVFFRKNTRQKANELHIYGWVKNTTDDKVEIFAQGNEKDLDEFINWCKQGPAKAEVKNVEVTISQTKENIKDFSIVYEN